MWTVAVLYRGFQGLHPLKSSALVKLGEDAPNSSVVHVSSPEGGDTSGNGAQEKTVDGTECHLLDFASPERPLVVNFGSAT